MTEPDYKCQNQDGNKRTQALRMSEPSFRYQNQAAFIRTRLLIARPSCKAVNARTKLRAPKLACKCQNPGFKCLNQAVNI